MTDAGKFAISIAVKLDKLNRVWITNGIKTKQIKPIELNMYLSNGWQKGRKIDTTSIHTHNNKINKQNTLW